MLIVDYLKEKKIKAEVIKLETPFPTTKHVARYFGITERQIFVANLLQGENKRLVMCIYSAAQTLNFKEIEEITGIKRLRFADREVVQKTTGFQSDGMPPIGFTGEFPVLMEEKLLEQNSGYAIGGEPTILIKISPQDIQKYSSATLSHIVR